MFLVSKIVGWLTDPASLLGMLAIASSLAFLFGVRWLSRLLASLLVVSMAVITVTPVGVMSLAALETRFPKPELPAAVDGIIVLGGAIDPHRSARADRVILSASSARLRAFADLANRYPTAMLVYTGGSGSIWNQDLKEADAARPLLRDLLGADRQVILERQSRNSWENAVFSHDLVGPGSGATWILVTSASHMPRAVGCFRKVGWPVIPYPADREGLPLTQWRPDFLSSLNHLRVASHELIGLLAYAATGRVDSVWPGPDQ